MSLPRWRRKVQDDRIFSSSRVTWLEIFVWWLLPRPLATPSSVWISQKKNVDIPTKSWQFWRCFSTLSACFLVCHCFWGRNGFFATTFPRWYSESSTFMSISSSANHWTGSWQKGVEFFVVPPRNVGWCRENLQMLGFSSIICCIMVFCVLWPSNMAGWKIHPFFSRT